MIRLVSRIWEERPPIYFFIFVLLPRLQFPDIEMKFCKQTDVDVTDEHPLYKVFVGLFMLASYGSSSLEISL
jgi:hypothetical protein